VIIGYHGGLEMAYGVRPVGKSRYALRTSPAKNGQVIAIMYEADYRLTSLDQIKPIPIKPQYDRDAALVLFDMACRAVFGLGTGIRRACTKRCTSEPTPRAM